LVIRAAFVVRDHNGQALACIYFEEEREGVQRPSCSVGMKQRIAANITKLPELLCKS
jgi:hypothetical protein